MYSSENFSQFSVAFISQLHYLFCLYTPFLDNAQLFIQSSTDKRSSPMGSTSTPTCYCDAAVPQSKSSTTERGCNGTQSA